MATPDEGRKRSWRFRLNDATTLEVSAPTPATEKQVRRRGRWSLILGTLIAAGMLAAVALGDNLQNDVVGGGNDTITAGGSTIITYRLVGNAAPGGDINGCNVDGSNQATMAIILPVNVSASSTSVLFSACGNAGAQSVTFSSNVAGDYAITHSISGGKAGALYNNQANWTLHVNAASAPDGDNDGVPDSSDNCPSVANAGQQDADNDGIGDACEADTDGDGVIDDNDNCPNDANADQADADNDGLGNACDSNSYAPAVASAAADANGFEGSALNTSGSFSDQDDNSTLTITKVSGVDTVDDNGNGNWDWSYTSADNATGTVVVQASDGEHTAAQDSFTWTAANANPVVGALTLGGASATACIGGNTATLNFGFSDAGVNDNPWAVDINWGDGNHTAYNASSQGAQGQQSHSYAAGSYTVSVSVTDKDSGVGSNSSAAGAVSFLYNVSGVLQPVNNTQAHNDPSIFKYGSTIPVKIKVTDCNNLVVSGLSPQIAVKRVSGSTPPEGDEEITSTSGADSGTTMRYSDGLYIYNLATRSLADNTATYEIKITGPFATVTTLFGTRAK